MKKHTRIIAIVSVLLLCTSVCIFSIFADDTSYQGSDLPVSESYVIRALNTLEDKLSKKIDALAKTMGAQAPVDPVDNAEPSDTENTEPTTETNTTDTPTPPSAVSCAYEVISLTKGQSITGACEIILRSGTAAALCPGANGISDLTEGIDIAGNTAIITNHLLLIPRDDGRGLTITSDEAYLMVRGPYTIK